MTKRQAAILALRACADIVESMAADLGSVDDRLARLSDHDADLIEQQALAIAQNLKVNANQLERAG